MKHAEQTFIMIKPDGVKRQLIGEILTRFERKGFVVRKAELLTITPERAKEHYQEHKERPFFGELVSFITSGPVFACVLEGENVVELTRLLVGKTDPRDAQPGTIRGDYASSKSINVIHASDSVPSANREIALFFGHERE